MENKLRRGLALLMTLIMLISCAPMDALAAIVPVSGGTQTSSGVSLKSIVKPPVATTTYVFMNGTEEFARQILKNGQTLNNPGTPTADSANKEFVGWFDESGNQLTFPITASVGSDSSTITVNARFADVYFVFFTNEKGEVMVTKKGANGDTISTDGVTYPVGNEQSIVGWKDASGNLVSSVTLNGRDVTLTAKVENGHWITYDSQGGTYVAPAFVKANGTTTAPENPTRPGYTFKHWSETVGGAAFTFGQRLDQALTLHAVWTANTNTRYTVIHWLENADDDGYSYRESETKYGTTGAQTSAAEKSYTGFTLNTDDKPLVQETIAGDGSTIVSVYYKRNVYQVKFFNNSGRTEDESKRITAKHGAFIGDKWPGGGWYVNKNSTRTAQSYLAVMPIGGKNFYGQQTNGYTQTATYYVEVLPGETGTTVSGKTYKVHHTDSTKSYNDLTVSDEERYDIDGYTCNTSISTKNGRNYDGAKFYYTRNSYNIVYVSGGQTVNTASKKFEESIADAGSYTPATKPVGMEDYVFGGWYADQETTKEFVFTGKTMPSQNITVYAKWSQPTSSATAFTTIIGGSSETIDPIPYGGTITDQLNSLQETIMKDKTDYTWRGWRTGPNGTGEPFNVDTKIYSNITLYPYYTKDGTFTVEYVSGKNDVTAPVDTKSYAEDSFADLKSPGKLVSDGEYFLGWSDGAATYQPRDKYQIKSNHADERNVITLTAQWGARPAGTTLTYKANGGAGEDVVENLANNATVTTKPAGTFSRVGYTFKGWDTNPKGEGSIAPDTQVQVDNNGANVLYAIWTANADTKYTVEFYYQNTDGTYTLNHSDERQGTTDTTASVTKVDKADKENGKYVFEADNKDNVLSGIINGAGSLVLKLYFKLNTASYTIHHYLNGTTVKVADDQTGAMTIGETLTANKSGALYLAYAAAEVAVYTPSQKITINATGNVITVYYTVPLTITAENANKTYDGDPLTQPDFKMAGLVNGDTKENFSLSMTAASTITNAGSTPNVIDTDTVKYNGGAIPSYYNVSYENGTLTVNKASATVTITGVNETAVYDGKQHEANGYNYSFTGKPGQITISLKPNVLAIARRTDVGTTNMGLTKDSFTVTSANYDVTIKTVIDGYVAITPVTDKVTVTVTENGAIVTYDGNEHSVKGYKSMTADNALYDVTTSVKATETAAWTAKGTNAGEYPVGIAAGDFENTNKNFTNVTFKVVDDVLKINPITENTITITANSNEKTYDGTPLTDNGFDYTKGVLADGDVLTAVVEGSATNVGDEGKNVVKSYAVKRGDVDVTGNYTFGNSIDGKLTINPRKVTLKSADLSKMYDGTPLVNGKTALATEDGFASGEGATYTFTGSQTVVGSSVNAFTYTLNEGTKARNYEVAKTEGTLTVTQNEKAITVTANSHTWEYDGQPHSDGGYTVEYDGQTYKVAAGETATLTTGDVVKATVEGIVTNVADSADDNNVVTNVTIANRAGDTVNDQYKTITRVNGGLKITKRGDSEDEDKKVKIIAEPNTVGYDGSAHGAKLNAKDEIELGTSYTTARLVDGHYVDETTLDITGSQTSVGVYENELKPAVKEGAERIVIRDKDDNDVTDNYALTLVPATLTITGDKIIPDKKAEDENIESNYNLGDKIEFTITVKNVSIYDVENVIVTDANAEIQAGDGYTVSADKHTATIAIIAAKSEIRIKALHTVTSEDILAGKVGNEANVKWKDGETTVGDDTTKLTPPNVTLNVTKTSDWEGKATGAKLKLGTKITYTITVKNAGNVPYTNVNFTDLLQNGDASVTGDIKPCETLPVNGEYSFTAEYIVTEADLLKESINNKVTAEADEIEYTYYEGKTEKTGKAKPKGEAEVTDNTDAASASFTSTKTTTSTPKNEKGYALGETITYEIKVTNDGNLTLTDVEVTEKLTGAVIKASRDYTVSGSVATIAELKPGQTVIVNVEYVVTEADILAGSVKNVATVTGKGPDDKNPDPDKPGTEDPTDEPKATLEIVKAVEGDPENGTSYALGEKITYTLTVKVGADNNVTVKDIRVTDTLLTAENVNAKIVEIAGGYTLNATGEIELPDMAPGADDVVITYTYTVQESDLGSGKYGSVHNAATVKGTTPEQGPENPNPKPDDPKDDANIDTPTNIRLIITAKDNLGIEYDGDAHGENGYDATGLATGHKITNVTISGSQTNVGRYENELVPDAAKIEDADGKDVTSHYEIKYVRGTLEIIQSQKALKVVANSNSWTYDDAEHSDGGYTVTYGEESYTVNAGDSAKLSTGDKVTAVITKQVKNVSDTAAGNNEIVTLTVENESQYASIIQEAGTLTITQRPVKITVNSKTFTYDAAEHTVADEHGKEYAIETAAENSGLLPGHTESLNVVYDDGTTKTESRKYVGTYTADSERDENGKAVVTITKEDSGEDVTANYAIVVIPGELEIKKAEALIKIVGPDSERVYNGQKQVVRTTDITTDPDYAPSEEEPDKIKILVTGLIPDDYIEIGTVIHVAEGTYVGKYEGNFEWDGLHKDEKIPTVLNDGIDVTQNYRFEYAKGWLTIKSNQPGEHPTKPDKEIDGHEPGTKYALGDRIYFTITVRNITNSDLKNVHVSDPTAVIVPGDGYTVVDEHHAKIENMPASVDGQEPTTVIINAYHVVTEDDIKNIVIDSGYKYENVATITVGDKTIDARKGTNDIEDADYTLKIEKQLINRPASGEKFKLGETAKFQITVTNEGNVTQTDIPVAEKLPGAVFTEGDGYTLNADKTVATITKVLNPADKETQHGDSIILYAQYTITENDLGNTGLKNIVTAPNGKPGEEPIPVDEAKSMAGQKIWNDLDNLYDTRTESVTVNLMRSLGRGGAAELIRTVTVTQNSGWRYSFDHLPAHDMQDNEYFYWVEEEPITGYETVYEMSDDSHCDIVNNLQTYTLTIHYWQHKLGDTKMEQAFPDYVATLYYKQPYDVESPEREGIILDDMSQARISGTMPAHDLVIDVYYHRIAYRLTIHYIYQDGTMAHEDYTWTYWFNSTYNVPSPIIPGFTPSIDVIAGRIPSHGLELTVVYVGDGEIVIPDEDTSLGFKSYLNAGECFE